jgi:hypothetical protein
LSTKKLEDDPLIGNGKLFTAAKETPLSNLLGSSDSTTAEKIGWLRGSLRTPRLLFPVLPMSLSALSYDLK